MCSQFLFRKQSNLLNASVNLRIITRSKAVSPTHLYYFLFLTNLKTAMSVSCFLPST